MNQDKACVVLLHQWQLWHMEEIDALKRTLKEMYRLTSGAPMDSLNGKLERLDHVHELVKRMLSAEERLECFEKGRIELAKRLMSGYVIAEGQEDWREAACMRTVREIWEALNF